MGKEYKSTMVEMVQELEKIEPRYAVVQSMIAEAKDGEYHDYKNKKYDCGKVAVLNYLFGAAQEFPDIAEPLNAIRDDLMRGVYDEKADEDEQVLGRAGRAVRSVVRHEPLRWRE